MSDLGKDRNLLVAILALQLDFVKQAELISAMQLWLTNKGSPFEQILVDQGIITSEVREFLSGIANRHLELHHNNVEESLSALSSVEDWQIKLPRLDNDSAAILESAAARRKSTSSRLVPQSEDGNFSSGILQSTLTLESIKVDDRFRILRQHAVGGLGKVSIAEDSELHREVAFKEIRSQFSNDTACRERFVMEAEVTGRLEHPGIVPVYSLGKSSDGSPFYVMRFIRGESLRESISTFHRSLQTKSNAADFSASVRKYLQVLVDVCNTIAYSHSRGVIHRDIKPDNVMLGKFGETLVVDWGLAKVVGKDHDQPDFNEQTLIPQSGSGVTETRMGSVVGTYAYMSPEQAEGRIDQLGPQSDVYCIGSTMYSILTGHAPIESASKEETLQRIRKGEIPAIRSLNPLVDPALEAICRKAMEVRLSHRYRTPGELREDLEKWLAGERVMAWQEPWYWQASRWVRKNQALFATLATAIMLSLVSLSVIAGLTFQQNQRLTMARDLENLQRQKAENRLDVTLDVTSNLIEIAEKALSQDQIFRDVRGKTLDKVYEVLTEIVQENPSNLEHANLLSRISRISANQKTLASELVESERRIQQAIELSEMLVQHEDYQELHRIFLIESLRDAFTILKRQDKFREAQDSLKRALALLEDPNSMIDPMIVQRELAWIGNKNILLQFELGQWEEALATARQNADQFRELLTSENSHSDDQRFLIFALYRIARILDELGHTAEAIQAYDEALAEINAATAREGLAKYKYELVRTLTWSAECRSREKETNDQAREQVLKALELLGPVKPTASPAFRFYEAEVKKAEGQVELTSERIPEAIACLEESIEFLNGLIAENELSTYNQKLSQCQLLLAKAHLAAGNQERYSELGQAAIQSIQRAIELQPENGEYPRRLGFIQSELAISEETNKS